ncbi:hypothetical protein BB559_001919 [Furculomyces boomerangus]|uniref:Uncharacterized protein n=2 Tax=Harpellales TaxID=61421 RepID=A0A2T9YZM3_9FUNG|nr:hypothetical protein BB559_001919 [Furculomyces boomerangus]PWA02283.1 hypothetical protein BB558_001583 [Smittium angustum]
MKIKGTTSIVTGGALGIGRATVERGKVVVADLKDCNGMVKELNEKYGEKVAVYTRCNVTNIKDLELALSKAVEEFGRFDILVNNAGIGSKALLWDDTDTTNTDRILATNLASILNFTRLAVQYWNKRPEQLGVVVNVASNIAFHPDANYHIYGAAKSGVVHFTSTCASLYPRIRVNAVAPGYVNTSIFQSSETGSSEISRRMKLGGVLEPIDVANQIVKCIDDESMFGETIRVLAKIPPFAQKLKKASKI